MPFYFATKKGEKVKTSTRLSLGKVYSRKDLQAIFDIKDATIRTGVFHPKGHNSIWLFVTEQKTPESTQYKDLLKGDILYWDGQKAGRTDTKVINHERDGVELILFYRKEKREHPNSAFRYEGPFVYFSHTGGNPSHFILRRQKGVAKE